MTTLKDRFESKSPKAQAAAFMKARPAFWHLWQAIIDEKGKSPDLSKALLDFNRALEPDI